jgi:3-hydroxyisobutyrate dehydrogenase-like beta-hydroxyacid dehydrogenase
MTRQTVGMIGLGIMGSAMSANARISRGRPTSYRAEHSAQAASPRRARAICQRADPSSLHSPARPPAEVAAELAASA